MNSPRSVLTDSYVLCQDCGHVEEYTTDRAAGREKCVRCGGSFCGCDCCNRLARVNLELRIHELNDREASMHPNAAAETVETSEAQPSLFSPARGPTSP